jgi:hypothetical protein
MSDKETLGEGRRQIGMKLRAAREEAEIDLADLSVRTGWRSYPWGNEPDAHGSTMIRSDLRSRATS